MSVTETHTFAPAVRALPAATQRLRPRQSLALVVVLAGGTDAEAAAKAGVRRETVLRWRHRDRAFIGALDSTRAQVANKIRDDLHALLPLAVRAVEWGLDAANPALRLRAAELLLRVCHAAKNPGQF